MEVIIGECNVGKESIQHRVPQKDAAVKKQSCTLTTAPQEILVGKRNVI